MTDHTRAMWFYDSSHCEHDEPEDDLSDEWHDWYDKHPAYDGGRLCKDLPAGFHCEECSEEDGPTTWDACRARPHARLAGVGRYPRIDVTGDHTEIRVSVGVYACLDGDCEEYEETDTPPEKCSHITVEKACMCQIEKTTGEVVRECTKGAS